MGDKPLRMPAKLGPQGRALWSSIVPAYELRPDELRILADACREADLIERLHEELAVSELTTKGSMGQEVAAPHVSEIRQHRTVLANLLKTLKIPDSPAGAARKRAQTSEAARMAARTRWGSGAGA
jgi:hypothetical protein